MGMQYTAKSQTKTPTPQPCGMGYFLIFFLGEEEGPNNKKPVRNSLNSILRRTNSATLLSKAQSTISICALFFVFTFLLFTLSTFDPKSNVHSSTFLRSVNDKRVLPKFGHALQGMGALYRRGTTSMNDVVVCNVAASVSVIEFGTFLRFLLRSSIASRSDVLFLFAHSGAFHSVVRREVDSFFKLAERLDGGDSGASFDPTRFVRKGKGKGSGESIWGRGVRRGYYGYRNGSELTRLSYGSVVGFDVEELDPVNSLAGFLEHVPMSLRRWACYTMLLGRIRRNFKHVMLVDVKDVLLLDDPLGRVRTRSPELVFLFTKHGRRNSDKTQSRKQVTPSIIMGGARGVRRLSNAMVTEIVRTTMRHKRKIMVSESALLSQLAVNEFVLKSVKFVVSAESIPDVSSVNSNESLFSSNYTVLWRNSIVDYHNAFMRHICSFSLDSSVYSDC